MIDSERRHELVLRAWEATNIERDLRSVMGAVAEVLSLTFQLTAWALSYGRAHFPPADQPRLLDIHVPGGLPNEKVDEILRDADKPVERSAGSADRCLRRSSQPGYARGHTLYVSRSSGQADVVSARAAVW